MCIYLARRNSSAHRDLAGHWDLCHLIFYSLPCASQEKDGPSLKGLLKPEVDVGVFSNFICVCVFYICIMCVCSICIHVVCVCSVCMCVLCVYSMCISVV